MDAQTRRSLLTTIGNPDGHVDYVTVLSGRLTGEGTAQALVRVRYVPDRLILPPEVFVDYLRAVGRHDWPSLEACACAVREDVNNELVPRWVQVVVSLPEDLTGCLEHVVILEDRQPGWDNAALLARLKPY
ncbi:MAG: hypothetical protein A2516_07645 [Alphaproteobacteria bacterium RIFOXYD12_FULL_60_8]|nr:MAG: hypothetical protein A2516_07645 [Alphaproteobacteria bacterium RIFOXYD12_FULL_60_8]